MVWSVALALNRPSTPFDDSLGLDKNESFFFLKKSTTWIKQALIWIRIHELFDLIIFDVIFLWSKFNMYFRFKNPLSQFAVKKWSHGSIILPKTYTPIQKGNWE